MEPILVVEDEPAIADLVCLTLEQAGYPCTVCHDGLAAADLLENGRFSLALLDIMLPGASGYALKEYLGDDMPVIFLTAKTAVADYSRNIGTVSEKAFPGRLLLTPPAKIYFRHRPKKLAAPAEVSYNGGKERGRGPAPAGRLDHEK